MKSKRHFDLSAATLHILAMAFMLCDHLWATVIPGNQWLTCLGRLAYPIFAFMIVEGYFHTRNLRRYVLRLFLFAIISEIPFNLMYSASPVYPYHQNVIWTLLIGIGLIHLNELVRARGKLWLRILTAICSILVGSISGLLCMVDYNSVGIITILVFYFLRDRKWWCLLGQFAALYYLNIEVLKGLSFEVSFWGMNIMIVQQGLALLALLFGCIVAVRGFIVRYSNIFAISFTRLICCFYSSVQSFCMVKLQSGNVSQAFPLFLYQN